MAVKASIRSGYRWRLALISLVLLGWTGLCLYDGLYKYPQHNRQRERSLAAFEQFQADHPESWRQNWSDYAREHGYAEEPSTMREYDLESDIYAQYFMAALCTPLGLLFGISYVRTGWRWVAMDETGLRTNAGQHATWDAIRSIDKSRWNNKGIAVVHYDDGHGKEQRIVLDDWKYQTEPTDQMVAEVEARLGSGSSGNASASASASASGTDEPGQEQQPTPATS